MGQCMCEKAVCLHFGWSPQTAGRSGVSLTSLPSKYKYEDDWLRWPISRESGFICSSPVRSDFIYVAAIYTEVTSWLQFSYTLNYFQESSRAPWKLWLIKLPFFLKFYDVDKQKTFSSSLISFFSYIIDWACCKILAVFTSSLCPVACVVNIWQGTSIPLCTFSAMF